MMRSSFDKYSPRPSNGCHAYPACSDGSVTPQDRAMPRPWREPLGMSLLSPDRLDGGNDLRQCIGIERDHARVLAPDQPRRGVGIVVQPCLIGLLQEPGHLLERARIALDDLVLWHRVPAHHHAQSHAFDIPLG